MTHNVKTKKVLTLCLIHEHPRILLALKKRGFGAGRWNGVGGKVEPGETIEEAAIREAREEIGIHTKEMVRRGIFEFIFDKNPELLEVHLFQITSFDGMPQESEEMAPQWFHVDEIPFSDMWPDDEHWMPHFLEGKNLRGRFLFDERGGAVLDYTLDEVDDIA